MEMKVVAFDFDETLTVRDTVVPFMRQIAGRAAFVGICIRNFIEIVGLVRRRDRDSVKELFVSEVFTGKQVDLVEHLGHMYAMKVVGSHMRSDTMERLRWHQEQGHVVVLVSASLSPYLHAVGDLLEVDAVLCTELQHENGMYSGFLDGSNCRGQEKVKRIQAWMIDAGCNDQDLQFAYGDSAGDDALLIFSLNGTNVRRKELSRAIQ